MSFQLPIIPDGPLYKNSIKSEFPTRSDGLKVLGMSTNIPKLTATSFEYIKSGFRPKPISCSKYISKGKFRNLPLYVLTLPERLSCPECKVRNYCYGDNMPFAKRMNPRSKCFRNALQADLNKLSKRHKRGYVVRLHELGDFFSSEYVRFWRDMLKLHSGLSIFGYSHQRDSRKFGRIGTALDKVFLQHRGRFNIMDSDASHGTGVRPVAQVLDEGETSRPGLITCPQQTKRSRSCVTCGLCMNGQTEVAFLRH